MSQVISPNTPGKERERLSKAIVITIRSYLRQNTQNADTKDMVAFIILALQEIAKGIDQSVIAWEKRGYWVKADKYRLEWQWTESFSDNLIFAFENKNFNELIEILLQIMAKFSNLKVSDRHRMGEPWINAHKKYTDALGKQ